MCGVREALGQEAATMRYAPLLARELPSLAVPPCLAELKSESGPKISGLQWQNQQTTYCATPGSVHQQ